jgi:hypothetical protein
MSGTGDDASSTKSLLPSEKKKKRQAEMSVGTSAELPNRA